MPEDPENNTVKAKYGTEALYSAVKSLMHAILTEDHDAQPHAAHQVIHIEMHRIIRRW